MRQTRYISSLRAKAERTGWGADFVADMLDIATVDEAAGTYTRDDADHDEIVARYRDIFGPVSEEQRASNSGGCAGCRGL